VSYLTWSFGGVNTYTSVNTWKKMPARAKSRFFRLSKPISLVGCRAFLMKADLHPKYQESEIRCACGNVIKTRSTKPVLLLGICNACHPFYTGTQKFVDTAGRVDKFQQRMAKTQAAQAASAAKKKKK
jgi:large subunit ribosomal protein L31